MLSLGDMLLDRYRIEAVVSRETTVSYYRAVDRTHGKTLLVKEVVAQPDDFDALDAQTQPLSRLRHAGLAAVQGVFYLNRPDGTRGYYLLTEPVELPSLEQHPGPKSQSEALAPAHAILDALSVLHRHGVTHGNLRPGTVLVSSRGRPCLVDFGFAPPWTARGRTSPFQAPEGGPSAAGDLYAVGGLLYWSLCGVHLPMDTHDLQASDIVGASPAVARVIISALHAKPNRRPRDASAMQAELALAVRSPMAEHADVAPPSLQDHLRRLRALLATWPPWMRWGGVALGVTLGVTLVGMMALWFAGSTTVPRDVDQPVAVVEPVETPTHTATFTATPQPSFTPTATVTPSASHTPSPSHTPTITQTHSHTPSLTPSDTPTPNASPTESGTPLPTGTPSPSHTHTHTPRPAGAERVVDLPVNGLSIVLSWVPPGRFTIGSPPDEPGRLDHEGPRREVDVDGFWLGRYEVTNAQFRAMRPQHRPEAYRGHAMDGDRQPVVGVSWRDAVDFCAWLGEQTGQRFRLPTEAEWEYACRAGTDGPTYWNGDSEAVCRHANTADRAALPYLNKPEVSPCDDGHAVTAPVGGFTPNAWNLHDMLGNVWELCADYYAPDAYSTLAARNPTGPATGASRVVRGGSWGEPGPLVRSAVRSRSEPDYTSMIVGFRVLLEDVKD